MARTRTSRELALSNWRWTETPDGQWALRDIELAAACFSAAQLERIANSLDAILSQIRSLGADGIHTAIRGAAAKARRAEKRERVRRKAAREARKADR